MSRKGLILFLALGIVMGAWAGGKKETVAKAPPQQPSQSPENFTTSPVELAQSPEIFTGPQPNQSRENPAETQPEFDQSPENFTDPQWEFDQSQENFTEIQSELELSWENLPEIQPMFDILQESLAKTQRELDQTRENLAKTQQELDQTREDLAKIQLERKDPPELERETRLAPITREIITQIADNQGSLEDLSYYLSIPITLILDNPSRKMEINQGEVTYQEENNSQRIEINTVSQGKLADNSDVMGTTFAVHFPAEKITLNFNLNPEANRFDLADAVTDEGKKYQLHFRGAIPHLLISYQTIFSGQVVVQGFEAADAAPVKVVVPPPITYRLQVGAFKVPQNVTRAFATLTNAGFTTVLEPYRDLKRVLITGIKTEEINRVKERLMSLGYGNPIISREE
jgi:hypothetical protein